MIHGRQECLLHRRGQVRKPAPTWWRRDSCLRRLGFTARIIAVKPRSGQALIETAIVLPFLLILLMGVVAIAQLTQAQMAVSAVSRESARAGALQKTAGDARSYALSRGQSVAQGYDLKAGRLSITVDAEGQCPGDWVQTTVQYTVSILGVRDVPVRSSDAEQVDVYRSWEGTNESCFK